MGMEACASSGWAFGSRTRLRDRRRTRGALALDDGACLRERLGRRHVAESPSGHRERLGEAVYSQRSLPHARERGERDVLRRRVDDVLVYLVRQNQEPGVLSHNVCA